MKKTAIIVLASLITLATASAQVERPEIEREFDPPRARGIERQLNRIEERLQDTDLSERRRAFLEEKKGVLELQARLHDALRDRIRAMKELRGDEELTEEEREAAREQIRNQFREEIKAIKDERRARVQERRAGRDIEEEIDEEDVDG